MGERHDVVHASATPSVASAIRADRDWSVRVIATESELIEASHAEVHLIRLDGPGVFAAWLEKRICRMRSTSAEVDGCDASLSNTIQLDDASESR
jgi:hypothetical protein